MHRALVVLVMASIVASAPTYASGGSVVPRRKISDWRNTREALSVRSRVQPAVRRRTYERSCLSYGHSCWGAHGKRSNEDQTQMVVSKFGPIGLTERQARLTEYLLSQQQRQPQQQRSSEEIRDGDIGRSDVYEMEQPPRLYQLLRQFPRTYSKNSLVTN